jgi:Methyltransferase domain
MPSMNEIYEAHADRYDELVSAEDYQGNLPRLLNELVDWNNVSVFEAGVGTGRITKMYIDSVSAATCCDQSRHMLDFTSALFCNHQTPLKFILADNMDLPLLEQPVSLFLEGWSFGHAVVDCESAADLSGTISTLLDNAEKNLSAAGTSIIIETLGTNTETAAPPHPHLAEFYWQLEQVYQFQPHIIRTDYRFSSVDDASRVLGFFFGESMARQVCVQNRSTIPEWTGLWIKRK